MKTSFNPLTLINEIDEQCDGSKICWPFIPYVGEYESSPVKVMNVGKATYGWGVAKGDNLKTLPKENTLEVLQSLTSEFISKVESFYSGGQGYNSSFWRRTYMLVSALLEKQENLNYERNSDKSKKCFNSICWNNVFKFGSVEGNPPENLADLLIDKDKSLIEDIKTLNPDLIIFSTGSTYDEYLVRIFPGLKFETIEPGLNDFLKIKISGFKGLAIRTTHFQRLSNQKFERLFEYIKNHFQ